MQSVSLQNEFSTNKILLWILAVSFLLHGLVLVMVMTVDLPPPPSQAEYSEWVKRIATPPREAVLAPPEETYKPLPSDAKKAEAPKDVPETGGGSGEGKGAAKQAPAGGGGGGGNAKRAAVRQAVSGQGVLGVIGVSSGGGGGDFEDVFSSTSGATSGDLEGAMAGGKRGVALPSAGSGLGRKRIGGEGDGSGGGSGSGGTADIGGVAVAAGGSAGTGRRQEGAAPVAQVGSGEADLLSGNIDRKLVSSTIARKKAGFQRCFERGLKSNSELHGKLLAELTIGDDGSVIEVRFLEDTLKSKEVSDCVKGILMRLAMPKPQSGMATFKIPLAFDAAN